MAKAGKGKTAKAQPQKPIVVNKPQQVVQKVVETPQQKVVQQKPQPIPQPTPPPKPPEPVSKPQEPKQKEVVPENVNLSEEEFDVMYKLAETVDFKEGQSVFIKERSGDKWIAKQVSQIGVVGVDFAAINDLVLRGLAYIKK